MSIDSKGQPLCIISPETVHKIITAFLLDRQSTEPSIRSFRRTFVLQCIRNGIDVLTVSCLLGHSNVAVMQRYFKQTDSGLERAHILSGLVDN